MPGLSKSTTETTSLDHEDVTEESSAAPRKKRRKSLKKITKKHPEFELSYDMMLGIRHAVSVSEQSVSTAPVSSSGRRRTHSHKRHLTAKSGSVHLSDEDFIDAEIGESFSSSMCDSDVVDTDDVVFGDDNDELELLREFQRAPKFKFPRGGSESTPGHQMRNFAFKDYSPVIFQQLREWFQIDTRDYLLTLCGDFNLLEFLSNSKSGQFFFFSHNKQFLIKTLTRNECLFLRHKLLPSYFKYVSKQPYTLLTKFFGLHRITIEGQPHIYVVIMSSVFYTDKVIHEQYDLKGSTKGRKATAKEKGEGAILKDLDFVARDKRLRVGAEKARLFKEQLRRDTEFLRKLNIMDYSLLVGVHFRHEADDSQGTGDLVKVKKPKLFRVCTPQQFGIDLPDVALPSRDSLRGARRKKRLVDSMRAAESRQSSAALPDASGLPVVSSAFERRKLSAVDESAEVKVDGVDSSNPFTSEFGGMCHVDAATGQKSDEIYFIGIIDILQKYNRRKKMETFFVGLKHDVKTISSVPPEEYAKRLRLFFDKRVL